MVDEKGDLGASLQDRATLASPQAPTGLGHSESIASAKCPLKQWTVHVAGYGYGTYTAKSRGAALADAWRSDAFCDYTFGRFLKIARAYRESEPKWWGAEITVEGKPAFYLGHNRAYVNFVYPDGKFQLCAHPYDVLPEIYRPECYRTTEPTP